MFGIMRQVVRAVLPSRANHYRPRFLSARSLGVLLSLVVLIECGFVAQSFLFREQLVTSVLPGTLAVLANDARKEAQVPTLLEEPLLAQAAEHKAKDMALRGYFSHETPEGEAPWIFLDEVGYRYSYAGENLALNFSDSVGVNDAWLSSPSHRANLLNADFSHVGVGVATGTYQGKETVFVVQFLAAPAEAAVPSPSVPVRKPAVKDISSVEPQVAGVSVQNTPASAAGSLLNMNNALGLLGAMGLLFAAALLIKLRATRREVWSNSLLAAAALCGLFLLQGGHSLNVEIPETAASVGLIEQY